MQLAQKLYEGIQLSDGKAAGLITYMRTDGCHVGIPFGYRNVFPALYEGLIYFLVVMIDLVAFLICVGQNDPYRSNAFPNLVLDF